MSTIEDLAWNVGRGLRNAVDSVNDVIDGITGEHDDNDPEDKTTFTRLNGDDYGSRPPYVMEDGEGDPDRAVMIDMADGTKTIWAIHVDQRNHDALKIMGQVLLNGLDKKDDDSRAFMKDLTEYDESGLPVSTVLQYVDNGRSKKVKSMAVLSIIHHVNGKPVEDMSSDDLYVPYNPYVNGKYGRGNWPWPIEDRSKYKYAPRGYR